MRPENFDDIIAQQAAQTQVIMMALRRIATLSREANICPLETAAHWTKMGGAAIDQTELHVAPGHETLVRDNAKARMKAIIDLGLR